MLNTYSSTLTSKGQATIPIFIREKLNIKPGERLLFEENELGFILKTHSQLVNELAGSLKPGVKVKYTDKKANEAIGKFLAEEYRKKYGKIN